MTVLELCFLSTRGALDLHLYEKQNFTRKQNENMSMTNLDILMHGTGYTNHELCHGYSAKHTNQAPKIVPKNATSIIANTEMDNELE